MKTLAVMTLFNYTRKSWVPREMDFVSSRSCNFVALLKYTLVLGRPAEKACSQATQINDPHWYVVGIDIIENSPKTCSTLLLNYLEVSEVIKKNFKHEVAVQPLFYGRRMLRTDST